MVLCRGGFLAVFVYFPASVFCWNRLPVGTIAASKSAWPRFLFCFGSLFCLGCISSVWGGCYCRNLTSIRSIDRPRRAVEQVQKCLAIKVARRKRRKIERYRGWMGVEISSRYFRVYVVNEWSRDLKVVFHRKIKVIASIPHWSLLKYVSLINIWISET